VAAQIEMSSAVTSTGSALYVQVAPLVAKVFDSSEHVPSSQK